MIAFLAAYPHTPSSPTQVKTTRNSLLLLTLTAHAALAGAATWSDTSVGLRFGEKFAEPGIPADVRKTILNMTHASGDSYGVTVLYVDALKSGSTDPASPALPVVQGPPTLGTGAHEVFLFAQRSLSLNTLLDAPDGWGPLRDLSLYARYDYSAKNTRFAPGLRALRLGVEAGLPVPAGRWSVTLAAYRERNHNGYADLAPPGVITEQARFKTVPALGSVWSIPVFDVATFGGIFEVIAPRGRNGFGNETRTETLLRTTLLFNIGGPKSGFRIGPGWEYWNHKFGSQDLAPGVPLPGTRQRTPMLVFEAHL